MVALVVLSLRALVSSRRRAFHGRPERRDHRGVVCGAATSRCGGVRSHAATTRSARAIARGRCVASPNRHRGHSGGPDEPLRSRDRSVASRSADTSLTRASPRDRLAEPSRVEPALRSRREPGLSTAPTPQDRPAEPWPVCRVPGPSTPRSHGLTALQPVARGHANDIRDHGEPVATTLRTGPPAPMRV